MRRCFGRTTNLQCLRVHSTLNTTLVYRNLFIRLALAAVTCGAEVQQADAGPGTVIVNENFEDGSIDGFTEVPNTSPSSKIISGESHGVGTKAYQITYAVSEFEAKLSRYPIVFDSIDASYSQKLPDGIPIERAGRGYAFLKDFRLFHPAGAGGHTTVEPAMAFHRNGFDGGPAYWQQQIGVLRFDSTEFAFYPNINVVPGQWHRVRYYVKYNDPGQRNGRLMYWFNGELKVNATGLYFCDSLSQRATGVFVGGNFSYDTNPDFPFRRLLDEIVITINGDAPVVGNPLTIAPVAKQTIKEDGETTAIPIKVSRNGAALGQVRLTATSSNTAIVPANGLTVAGSGANWTVKAKPAANKQGAITIRMLADDGAGVAATAFDVVINAVADTPSITVASTTTNMPTTCGLVVSRNQADGAEVTHFKITGISHGSLYLADGRTVVNNGSFLTFAQANAGLRFKPATGFVGTATFNLQASTTATDAGLGGSAVKGQIFVYAR